MDSQVAERIEAEHPEYRFRRRDDGTLHDWGTQPLHAVGEFAGRIPFAFRVFHGRAHLWLGRSVDPVASAHLESLTAAAMDDIAGIFATLAAKVAVDVVHGFTTGDTVVVVSAVPGSSWHITTIGTIIGCDDVWLFVDTGDALPFGTAVRRARIVSVRAHDLVPASTSA